jgi:hypothetical protein
METDATYEHGNSATYEHGNFATYKSRRKG